MIGKFHLPISAGGSLPDPTTYCPLNGYIDPTDPEQVEDAGLIPNPINPADGWELLAEFQTNSPYTATFDPLIQATSGEYAWDLGDGTILVGQKAVLHTYLTTETRTVKLYGKGTCNIATVDFRGDNIVGEFNISNEAFKSLANIYLQTNEDLISIIFPTEPTGVIANIQIYETGITGTLDLSIFDTFSSAAIIYLYTNPSLTGVIFASSITGTISDIRIYSTGIIGTLDLSIFATFTTTAIVYIRSNSSITGITFASSITGAISQLHLYGNGIIGTLDLSMFAAFTATTDIRLNNNASLTGIAFASSITGTISYLAIYSTGIIGTLDLSMFTAFTNTASVLVYLNTSLTGVIFPSSTITGLTRTLQMNANTIIGYIDMTKLRTGVASLAWRFDTCGWTAAIVNHVLVDIDAMSASGFTGRVINVGGTNADPDTTSGGYNGTAARNSLIAKGFTVTIT